MRRCFYISGPMRGIPLFNFPKFDRVAARGRSLGYGVASPADMDRELGHTENDDLEAINTPANMRSFASRDCSAILAIKSEEGGGIALLEGWERSTGGTAELFLSKWTGLQPVDGETYQPFAQDKLDELDLTPLIQGLRKYLGDKNWASRRELPHGPQA